MFVVYIMFGIYISGAAATSLQKIIAPYVVVFLTPRDRRFWRPRFHRPAAEASSSHP